MDETDRSYIAAHRKDRSRMKAGRKARRLTGKVIRSSGERLVGLQQKKADLKQQILDCNGFIKEQRAAVRDAARALSDFQAEKAKLLGRLRPVDAAIRSVKTGLRNAETAKVRRLLASAKRPGRKTISLYPPNEPWHGPRMNLRALAQQRGV